MTDQSHDHEDAPEWRQVDGDMSPGAHGGTIARVDDDGSIELRQIQPVREYIGDREAANVGFPFWTREATFDRSELSGAHPEDAGALRACGFERLPSGALYQSGALDTIEGWDAEIATAITLLTYGCAEEGPHGWADDVVPGQVVWFSGETAGPEYLANEDAGFRQEILGEDEDEDEDE